MYTKRAPAALIDVGGDKMITKECAIKVRISQEMNDALKQRGAIEHKTTSEMVREAIDKYLQDKEKK